MKAFLLIPALFISTELLAVQGGPELNRHLVSMYGAGEGEVWGQLDYVDDSFNVFGYGSSSSGINYSAGASLGGKLAFTDRWNVQANYSQFEDEAWRLTEPKVLKSSYRGTEVTLQHLFYVGEGFEFAWHLTFRDHKTLGGGHLRKMQFSDSNSDFLVESGGDTVAVTKTTNGVIEWAQSITDLGNGSVEATGNRIPDGNYPLSLIGLDTIDTDYLVSATPKDAGVGIGFDIATYPTDQLRFTLGGELRRVDVETNYNVNSSLLTLLDNPLVAAFGLVDSSVIMDQVPQLEPWEENHFLITAGADWDAYEDLSFAAQYTFYTISRDGYQSTVGKVSLAVEDQTTNHQLDGWVFVKPQRDLTLYLHGRAYSNFLLGDRPLLYNARVNHKFTDPYGFLSVGAVWEF